MRFVSVWACCAGLAACGGSSTSLQTPINSAGVTVTVNDDVLSISGEGIAANVPRGDEDAGLFATGEAPISEDVAQFLAVATTDDTFAALVTTTDTTTTAQTFYGRTAGIDAFPSGTAIFVGDYVGSFENGDGFALDARITGRANLNVDFDDMTIAGFVDQRTLAITFSPGVTLPFIMNGNLLFDQTSIEADGTFAGNVTVLDDTNETTTVYPGQGTFNGVFGGADASEAVGVVSVDRLNEEATSFVEVGAFAAGR